MRKRLWGIALVAGVAIAAAGQGPLLATPMKAAATTPARAVFAPTHPVAYVPIRTAKGTGFDVTFGNLDYNGGVLMPSNTNYMVLWSPKGTSAYPKEFVSGLETYFKDVAHDSGGHQSVESTSAQYNDSTGAFAQYKSTFGGALVDTHAYPKSQCPAATPVIECLTDAQIQAELVRFVSSLHLKMDLTHEYFMLPPPHVESCFTNVAPSFGGCSAGEPGAIAVFCAYHSNTAKSPFLIYSNNPFDAGNPGCDDGNHPNGISDGEIEGGLSHEHNESITDPIPNDAWTNGAGANHGLENGDQCVGQMGTPLGTHNGAMYNQVINGHFYWYQEEWSNQTHSCLQRLTPATKRPVAKFTVTAGSGLTLNFNATGSSAPGGIAEYVWQFNSANGASTVEQKTPTISHTFPSAGSYSIGLTIMAKDGTSTGNGGIVTTGHSGTNAGFTVGSAMAGKPVSFSALKTVSAQPVTLYFWQFGDGTTGSGRTPTHVYSKSGHFKVELLMFSGVGSAFPGAGAAPISTMTITVK